MKKIISIITLITILTSTSFAAFSNKDVGTSALQFLKIEVGSREAALAGASAGVSRDVNSLYFNPAGLNGVENKEASFMHCVWIEEITYDEVAYAQKLKNGVFGVMINYLTMTGIEKVDNLGNRLGETYKPNDLALTVGYAKKIKKIDVGINLKYISSKIEEEGGSAIALDFGTQYKVMKEKLNLGLVLQNLGTKIKYINVAENLPLNIKIGGAYTVDFYRGKALIALDINAPIDEEIKVNVGAEYKHEINNELNFSPRLGYRTDKGDLEEGSNALTGGFGVGYKKFDIDYAWSPYGELGQTHKISIKAKF